MRTAVVEPASMWRAAQEVPHSDPQEMPIPSLLGLEGRRKCLGTLRRRAPGQRRLREWFARRPRACMRQTKYNWRLQKTRGVSSVLEEFSARKEDHLAAQKRLDYCWAFVGKYGPDVQSNKGLDDASMDYVDLESLSGDGSEVGEKLLAALERWSQAVRQRRTVVLPKYRKELRRWRENGPCRGRLHMPEEVRWLPAAALAAAGAGPTGWCHVSRLEIYLRLNALPWLFTDDVVLPMQEKGGTHVSIGSPVERGEAKRTDMFDETVLLGENLVPFLKELLAEQVELPESKKAADESVGGVGADLPVPLWDFETRRVFAWRRGTVTLLGLPEMEALCQCRPGGASRDFLQRRGSETGVQVRLLHASAGSSWIYEKPGHLQHLVNKPDPTALSYALPIQDIFSMFFHAGKFQELLATRSRVDIF